MIPLLLALLTATPATLPTQILAAQCGDTVQAVGVFVPKITIKARPACAITIDLNQATVQQLAFQGASNWSVVGGDLGAGAPYNAVLVQGSDHLSFRGATIHGWGQGAGVTLLDSRFITIEDNRFQDAAGDGVDVVSTTDVVLRGNTCAGLVYSTVIHADCAQLWTKPGDPIVVANVRIDGNRVFGHSQGWDNFGAGDTRPMVNIVMVNNIAAIDMVAAGALSNCTGCVMSGNRAVTLMGMPHGWEHPDFKLNGAEAAGNVAGANP